MGPKNISKVLKRHAMNAFFAMPLEWLSGKRIAIDAFNWMYTNMAIARKKVINKTDIAMEEPSPQEIRREWFLALINFIIGWSCYNITLVFVFDGKHPSEKDQTKEERRNKRLTAKAKIDKLYEQLRGDILDQPINIVNELRKELRNYNSISPDDFELFKNVLKVIGMPCLQAIGDGEQLCASLCIDGKVAAVFSTDFDNLAFGAPLMITGFSEACTYNEYGHKIAHVDCVRLDLTLAGLNMTHDVFVDLCIMSGCDFNTNIPGYGSIKSYNLLQKHGSIDNLPHTLNIECLNYLRCRDIFKYVSIQKLTIGADDDSYDLSLDLNKEALITSRDILESAGVAGQISRLITCYQKIQPASDGYVEQLALEAVPRYIPPQRRLTLNIIPQPKLTLNIIS